MDRKELLRAVKFTLFSISAGVIEIVSFSLLTELTEEEAAAWTTRREEKNSTEQTSFRDAMGELLKQKVQRGERRD